MNVSDRLAGGVKHCGQVIGNKIADWVRCLGPTMGMKRQFKSGCVHASAAEPAANAGQNEFVMHFGVPAVHQDDERFGLPVFLGAQKPTVNAIVFRAAKLDGGIEFELPAIGEK